MGQNDTLAQKIENWLQSRKNSSLGLLSKLTDVPYVTLRRIQQGETEAGLQTAIQIASVIMTPEEAADYICKKYDGMGRFLQLQVARGAQPITLEKAAKRLSKEEFLVMAMACSKSATSKDEVASLYGHSGLKALSRLLEVGLLKELDGRIALFAEEAFLTDGLEVSNWLRYTIDEYDIEASNKLGMLTSVVLQGFSDDGVRAVHRILQAAEAEMLSLMKDEKNLGDNVLSVGLISNLLTKK